MAVWKIGGSCLRTARDLQHIGHLVAKGPRPLAVVVSALFGVTDILADLAHAQRPLEPTMAKLWLKHMRCTWALPPVLAEAAQHRLTDQFAGFLDSVGHISFAEPLPDDQRDTVLALGERLSAVLVTAWARAARSTVKLHPVLALTDARFGCARLLEESAERVRMAYRHGGSVHVMPGFVARCATGAYTTLGRGGSDLSAVHASVALGGELTLWKDTPGVLAAPPTVLSSAPTLAHIHWEDAAILGDLGLGVVAASALHLARRQERVIFVRGIAGDGEISEIGPRPTSGPILVEVPWPVTEQRDDLAAWRRLYLLCPATHNRNRSKLLRATFKPSRDRAPTSTGSQLLSARIPATRVAELASSLLQDWAGYSPWIRGVLRRRVDRGRALRGVGHHRLPATMQNRFRTRSRTQDSFRQPR